MICLINSKIRSTKPYSVRLAIIYGCKRWAVEKHEIQTRYNKLHTTHMKMLKWARDMTNVDHIKHEDVWREASIEPIATYLRKKRLKWYGHVLRKEMDDYTKKMSNMLVQGKIRRDGWTTSGMT